MLEKIKQKLEKAKQKRITERKQKETAEIVKKLTKQNIDLAYYQYATFSHLVARTLLKDTDCLKVGTNGDIDYYLVKIGEDHYAIKIHGKIYETENSSKKQRINDVKREYSNYVDINTGFYVNKTKDVYSYAQLSTMVDTPYIYEHDYPISLTDFLDPERKLALKRNDSFIIHAENVEHTEQEKACIKCANWLIEKVDDICAKYEKNATEEV